VQLEKTLIKAKEAELHRRAALLARVSSSPPTHLSPLCSAAASCGFLSSHTDHVAPFLAPPLAQLSSARAGVPASPSTPASAGYAESYEESYADSTEAADGPALSISSSELGDVDTEETDEEGVVPDPSSRCASPRCAPPMSCPCCITTATLMHLVSQLPPCEPRAYTHTHTHTHTHTRRVRYASASHLVPLCRVVACEAHTQ
jgi:hypothetical protein